MFLENNQGLNAYIKESNFNKNLFDKVRILNSKEFKIDYNISKLENKNWNEKWERDFEPVEIGQNCIIRAPFHQKSKKKYDIVIKPEMSFGTGHHETTRLMIEFLLEYDLENKTICDVGCGTGILSIISEKRGAKLVDALDIDPNCYRNTLTNIKKNNCKKINVMNSSSDILIGNYYDLILSNITLNILKENFKNFKMFSSRQTNLILSGFFKNDLENVNEILDGLNFTNIDSKTKNNWIAARYCYN